MKNLLRHNADLGEDLVGRTGLYYIAYLCDSTEIRELLDKYLGHTNDRLVQEQYEKGDESSTRKTLKL